MQAEGEAGEARQWCQVTDRERPAQRPLWDSLKGILGASGGLCL